jgi:glycosyltransferase involved in cell wall biosynthesis
MLLSVCIITKNEESNIARCLDSIKDIADEVVVYDTGSTDRTIDILNGFSKRANVKGFDLKVYRGEWKNDFSEARNNALDNAKGDWIFFIDADEELLNPNDLKNLLQNSDSNIGGYLWNLKSYIFEGGNRKEQTTSLLRIFRNHTNIRYEGIVHEQVLKSIVSMGLKVKASSINGIHHGYNISPIELEKKHQRNINLLERAISDQPTAYNYLQLGKAYMAMNQLKSAVESFEKAESYKDQHPETLLQIYYNLALAFFRTEKLDKALVMAEKCLSIKPDYHTAKLIIADIMLAQGKVISAIDHLESILNSIESSTTDLSLSLSSSLAGIYHINRNDLYTKIFRLYLAIGNKEKAKQLIDDGLSSDNANEKLLKLKRELSANISSSNTTIALCMIVKNEAENIQGALDSVKGIADEIVVVDTGSEDGTIEILKDNNVNIRYFEWCDDFSAARNESIKDIKSDWILYLDADERVKPLNTIQLKVSLSKLPKEVGGVLCTLESVHTKLTGDAEMHRGGYPRLFRNLGYPDIHFKGRVHEQITPSLKDRGLSIVPSDVIIEHHGYNRSRGEMEAKVKRNYRLLLSHVKEEPLNGYAWYQLGQTLGQMNLVKESENAIEFAIQTGSLSDSVSSSAYATLSQYAGGRKEFEKALEYAEKSLEHGPDQIYAMNLKGYALVFLNRKKEAEAIFVDVLDKYEKMESGIPSSGYDIVLPKSVINKGLAMARS